MLREGGGGMLGGRGCSWEVVLCGGQGGVVLRMGSVGDGGRCEEGGFSALRFWG